MAAENAEFREDEEPAALIETGRALVSKYMADAAPSVQPQAAELPVEGVIAGVRVHGIVDLLDTEGRIIDFKTVARRPGRNHTGSQLPVDDVFDDHAGLQRLLQTGHRHED